MNVRSLTRRWLTNQIHFNLSYQASNYLIKSKPFHNYGHTLPLSDQPTCWSQCNKVFGTAKVLGYNILA